MEVREAGSSILTGQEVGTRSRQLYFNKTGGGTRSRQFYFNKTGGRYEKQAVLFNRTGGR